MKLEKSIFYVYKVKHLGYIISEDGVKINSKKIYITVEWLTLRNISEVLFFLGFANFYHRFIKNYLKVIISLINLTKKNTKWV